MGVGYLSRAATAPATAEATATTTAASADAHHAHHHQRNHAGQAADQHAGAQPPGERAGAASRHQAAQLAAMVTNPRYYQTHRRDRHLQHKASVILQRMRQAELPQAE